MKSNKQYAVFVLIMLFLVHLPVVQGQDSKSVQDLDFEVDLIPSKTGTEKDNTLNDLSLTIESNRIVNPKKVYLKVLSIAPREVYFIRTYEFVDLEKGVDAEVLELEISTLEEKRKNERKAASEQAGKRRYKELWEAKRYEKQEGRSLLEAGLNSGDIELGFGPFPPGEFELFVGIKDASSTMHFDTRKILIKSKK